MWVTTMPEWKNYELDFTITIDYDKCHACLPCVENCPTNVLEIDEKIEKAVPVRIEDCTECCACVLVCPEDAITHSSC